MQHGFRLGHVLSVFESKYSNPPNSSADIQGIEDIAVVGPIIKELMDVGIKNDDNLVKLATLYQRLMAKTMTAESDVALLSDEEKEELMNALEDVSTDLQKKSDEIGIQEIRKKYGNT